MGVVKFERWQKIVIYALTFVALIVYLIYRALFTLPLGLRPVDIIFALVVFAIELLEAFEFFVYFWNVLRFRKESPKVPEVSDDEWPDVDVFVATVNESAEVLEGTLKACARMEHPDPSKLHIYLCDDGERAELKDLAEKYGAEYLARKKHDFAKAGNYNFALKKSKSPYVATFDADMRPKKDFLAKMLPFLLNDEKVGFVQAPQDFRNLDIFQARFSANLPYEQNYFYRYIQLARNNTNSVILCGTNCVISRKALKEVGGFACATIAEDVATGMLIESKGYKGVAIADEVARGEAVNDVRGFLRQRSRWGRGCIQTAKAYGIFSVKGMSWRQKLDYFVSINYWYFGIRRLFYMVLPLIFVLGGVILIEADLKWFLPIFLTQYVLRRFVIDLVEGRRRSATWAKICELVQAPYLAIVTAGELLGISSKKFVVTQKGESAGAKTTADWMLFLAHWEMLLLNALGLAISIHRMREATVMLYIIPTIWIVANICYMAFVLLFDCRRNYEPKQGSKKRKYSILRFCEALWRRKGI